MKRQTKLISFDDSCPNCFVNLGIGRLDNDEFIGVVCHRCGLTCTAHSPKHNVVFSGPDLRSRRVEIGDGDSGNDALFKDIKRIANDYTNYLVARKCKQLLKDFDGDVRSVSRKLELPMSKVKRMKDGDEWAWVTPILRSQKNYRSIKNGGSSKTKDSQQQKRFFDQLSDLLG